jgi:hypothetical protein
LLDQHAFTADRIQRLQQQRAQQRNNCSGGIDGRPFFEYNSSKRLDNASSAMSVIARTGRKA